MKIENFNVASGANVNIISDCNVTINKDAQPQILEEGKKVIEAEMAEVVNDEFASLKQKAMPFINKAIAKGFIKEENSRYKWQLSKTLLAYFIGKIFCNDRIIKDRFGDTWKGETGFPDKLVEVLFNETTIGALRRNKFTEKATPPKGYEKIDRLF